MKLSLFNTLTRKREIFLPLDINLIKLYVCGPTVYDRPHVGNARSSVIYDLLYRLLKYIYGQDKVLYVRNITDIDDKIIDRAAELGIPISELTAKTIRDFNADMEYLGCQKPTKEPKATEHVNDMIEIIQKLLDSGIAYKAAGHVYFDVSKADDYHNLSGRSLAESRDGVRIECDPHKKGAADFVLWKPAKGTDDVSAKFESPFGIGRPGWHIECSAMSNAFLGQDFDIHGGGIDLIFPHHTNEIAQSLGAFPGSSYARYWVHNGFLTVNGEKMSKSLGNFITVKDLQDKQIRGDVVRLLLLGTHYRKPLDYNDKAISDAEKLLDYWYRAMETCNIDDSVELDVSLPEKFRNALLEDLNIPVAIKLVNDLAKEIHNTGDAKAKAVLARKLTTCTKFLGLMNLNQNEWFNKDGISDNEQAERIDSLIKQRSEAKKEKDWALADCIRAQLTSMNVIIEDKPDGTTTWRKSMVRGIKT